MHAFPTAAPLPAGSPPRDAADAANIGLLLTQIEAMQAELDNLREQVDSRKQNQEHVEQERRLASRLQRDFLPKRLPNHARVKFNRLYRPAGHVSADLYDIRRLDEQHVGVYIAEAIGHGMPAALLAMFMHNALQTKRIALDGSYQLLPSQEAIRLLNEALCAQDLAHTTFATAIYACVNVQTGQLDLARGGHPLPILIRANGQMQEIGGEGALLGVLPEEEFSPVSLKLEAGDRLILFSNGVEQLFAPPGADSSFNTWRQAVSHRTHLSADELLAELWGLLEVRGNPIDDVTIVTVEIPDSPIDRTAAPPRSVA